ncbi:YheC/YheD family protein [Roseomonas sp. GC11]|uniref:YheC/YheD family protein n=1 Tax=Roseomonas sp. GC11 TaxID=2950546 RepID=UPI00210D2D56|nr:YheC/YheD family protein [Roseomonas sp. GC11]MCQ4162085.1 YheC/YheD family protein [Roseomonas sp. GC11]
MRLAILAFGFAPRGYMPPARVRAMLAEAALQGVQLAFLDSRDCEAGPAPGEGDGPPDGPPDGLFGEVWDGAGFTRRALGWPQVVFTLGLVLDAAAHALIARCRARGAVVLVEMGPDKLGFDALLAAAPDLAPHRIPTAALDPAGAARQLAAWAVAEGALVVKPADGRRGGGLFFLDRVAEGAGPWRLRRDAEEWHLPLEAAVAELLRRIRGRMAYRPYLVQRYVTALARDGRAADLRLHVQRGAEGAWGLTRAYVRLGECGLPLSNVSRGGYQGELPGFLAGRSRPAAALEAEATALALRAARHLTRHACPEASEWGIDLVLDRADHFWLLEANTHPGTALHEHERAVHSIAYARYLAHAARAVPGGVPGGGPGSAQEDAEEDVQEDAQGDVQGGMPAEALA